jgi:hypothetical protein
MGRTVGPRALAVSLALILMAGAAPVIHQHSDDAPAFYDEVCPLSQLLAGGNEAGLIQRVDLTQPLIATALAVLPVAAGNSTRSVGSFEPRAPPSPA